MLDAAISARDLGKRYRVWTQQRPTNLKERIAFSSGTWWARTTGKAPGHERLEIWALRHATFDVRRGEVLGVIGPNGAGKSTLLAILAHITEPTEGEVRVRGRVGSLLEVGTGFHPELTGRDNVFLNGAVLGMSRAETARKFDEIVDFAELRDFIDVPVKRYSTGMYTRLAFAVAAHLDPEILLVDEVLSVGDRSFQERSLARIEELTRSGRTVLFVSHDAHSVSRLCHRALLVRKGGIAYAGDVDEAIERYVERAARPDGYVGDVSRAGPGELRIYTVQVANRGVGTRVNEVVANRPMTFTVGVAAPRPVAARSIVLDIDVVDSKGDALVTLSSDVAPHGRVAERLSHGDALVCEIDELPLRPGTYYLSLALRRMNELVDILEKKVELRILPSDFFGDGRLAHPHKAPVLVRQRWRVAEAVEPVEPAASR